MTCQIKSPATLEAKLRKRAAAVGSDVKSFIVQALTEKLSDPKRYREIFAPMHEAFAEAPIPEDELAVIVDRARAERYRKPRRRKSKSS